MGDAPDERAAVELDGVCHRYADTAAAMALVRVTLVVRPGEVTALLGPNGAGKSTLLRVAAGLLRPTEGSVRLLGRPVERLDRRAIAREVALVLQSEAVAAGFRVREVVAMGRAPHQDGWMRERPADRAAVDDALARCDLTRFADRAVDALSGGEQRRVAIARALAQQPRVLMLDEPAAFLDVRHRLELHELLGGVAARDRIACLVAMHDLDEASRLATRVVLMREGRVVAAGAPAEVMTPALLRETFDADVDVGTHATSGQRYFVPLRARSAGPGP
ncbi:MAG TPA: ABC transporter ATP-binding protein [Polyangiaceae bacterium]